MWEVQAMKPEKGPEGGTGGLKEDDGAYWHYPGEGVDGRQECGRGGPTTTVSESQGETTFFMLIL